MKSFFRELVIIVVIALVIYLGLKVLAEDYVIRECSMEPTLYDGQRILVSKIVYRFHEPERGDIIIFRPPSAHNPEATPFIKRVIALPGETIEVKDGNVYVNGSKFDEPYIKKPPNYILKRETVEGGYFVLGDNRNNSNDSHTGWTVPSQNIIGKAWLSIWPPSKWGLANNYPLPEQIVSPNAALR